MNWKSGKNTIHFQSQGVQLVGDLYLPEGFDKTRRYPTVIFTGPINQIKEQMGAVYSKKLAEKGYVALSFDHLGFGESEGEIRNYENPFIKMESVRDGISYLNTLGFVDSSRLYGLGGCAGAGYLPLVTVTDKRMAAIATVSGRMSNITSFFEAVDRKTATGLFKDSNQARQVHYETGELEYYDPFGVESVKNPEEIPSQLAREGYDYYMTARAGAETYPGYSHRAPRTLFEVALLTDPTPYAPYLYTPYLGIYGEIAETANTTINFYNAASQPKELFEISGASHVALYDIDEYVDQAVAKMDEFFKKYSQ